MPVKVGTVGLRTIIRPNTSDIPRDSAITSAETGIQDPFNRTLTGPLARFCHYSESGGVRWEEIGLIADAVANRVRQVTELAKYSFPEDEKREYRQIPWDELARARDFYTHHYRDLDMQADHLCLSWVVRITMS
jgi:hypothetical protein